MAFKKWQIATPDINTAKMLAEECGTDPFAALIAVSRGISDPAEFELMMSGEPVMCEPRELIDIDKAASFLNNAVNDNKKIAVFGDYDCDGVTACAILYDYLKNRGANVCCYIPDRINEGYGMNKEAVLKLHNDGVDVIVTVDNGISCEAEVAYAKTLGIDVVVTDHHLPPENLPNAVAVVDPHRKDCPSSFKEICGAQVAFNLICVMEDKEPEQMLPLYADLLAVAVIGDVMPLVNENRSIVKYGINMIKRKPRVSISAIINSAGIDRNALDTLKVSFTVVPRINTAGRMGSALRAFDLLLCNDMMTALKMADILENENALRQKIEKEILSEAFYKIEQNGYGNNRIIVVSGENWHKGIIGIVASRICERYAKPAIVLSIDGDNAHGSGRSYEGFCLFEAIENCKDLLLKYGGHALAAGVSLKTEDIDAFRKRINEFALKGDYVPPVLKIDLKLNPAGMSIDMAYAIKTLEPFGTSNPQPQFAVMSVCLERIIPLSAGKHLKLMFKKGETSFAALLFSVSLDKFCFEEGDICDIAVTLDANCYKGENMLSVQIKAIRLSGKYDDRFFEEISAFDDFVSGGVANSKILLPSREEIGKVYKRIYADDISDKRLEYIFINDIGYAKTKISLKILCELNLIVLKDGIYSAVPDSVKTDLINSKSYSLLCGAVENGDG